MPVLKKNFRTKFCIKLASNSRKTFFYTKLLTGKKKSLVFFINWAIFEFGEQSPEWGATKKSYLFSLKFGVSKKRKRIENFRF